MSVFIGSRLAAAYKWFAYKGFLGMHQQRPVWGAGGNKKGPAVGRTAIDYTNGKLCI